MLPEWHGWLFGILLDSSLRISLISGVIALMLVIVRVRSGSVRHAAWTAVLCAMLLMPVLPYCLPTIAIPVLVPVAGGGLNAAAGETRVDPVAPGGVQALSEAIAASARPVSRRAAVDTPLPAPEARPAPRLTWALAGFILYGAGVLMLLCHLLLGWLGMVRIGRTAIPVTIGEAVPTAGLGAVPVYESTQVAAPLTAGLFSPKIILPATWKHWPGEKLLAILAHEYAHVNRRDPLVAMLAHVNRCIFWFHPLAWWLERKLAATAEHACDDAAVRAIGKSRRYAEVLLDMAEAVRRTGGRFSWQGVGVGGTGLLGQRIDRILRGDLLRETSRLRKALVATGCATAIFIIVACRQQPKSVAPLQEDPKFAEQQAAQKARSDLYRAAHDMSAQQVAELEASLKKTPDDLGTLEKLLMFYAPVSEAVKGDKGKWAPICAQVIGEKECIAARRPHILRLIAQHPESKLAGDWGARIYPTSLDPLTDPAGYAEAKKLWLQQTSRPDVNIAILKNAAYFFEAADKLLAEKMMLRAQVLDPKGRWSGALGRLYAFVILGSNSSTPLNVVRTVSMADAHSPYAQEVRRKLDQSTDPELLAAAGDYLTFAQGREYDFDPRALGKSYLERALQLNPQLVTARSRLVSLRNGERNRRMYDHLKDVPKESQYQACSALPEAERFEYLPHLAELAYFEGENAENARKPEEAKAAWERARKYAQDALALAAKRSGDPGCGTAIYKANMILGTLAMWGGDQRTAVRFMLDASRAPASEELAYNSAPAAERLVKYLLKYGERETVVEFLERMAQINIIEKDYILEAAAAIRRGQMPMAYQATMTKQEPTSTR
jgi:hypothetical protein